MTDFNQKTHDTDVGSHGGKSRQMMEVFENQEFGSIRLLQEAGKTFFCASDVAKALGYVNPYAAVKRHCRGPLTKREGVVQKMNQYGDAGEQVVEISFITEGDVYRLIVHSKLPSAERFEHWVFDEVLPAIRKHGVYMSDSILDQVIQHPEVIYTLAQELVAEREQLEGIRKQLDAAQPKTFFCASDVAKALGYVNPYAAVKRHCRGPLTKREGVVQKVNQYGDAGEQVVEIAFITEGDVYRLIVHSKLPSAERFEHWVFDEVLPSIRKHGMYMSDSILDQVIQHPEVIYTLAQELVAEREQLEGIRKQLDAAQPKADYFDTFVNSEDCTCIRNFCKEIGIPEKTAVALLLDHRYLYRSPSGWLMPFADKSARGYFIVRDCYGRSGKLVQQTRVTCKGKNHLSETETRDQFSEALDQMRNQADEAWESMRHSIPDLVYTTTEGETVAIEITTSNYTQDKIEAKLAVAAAIGAELQTIKI